jgi:hypothetical protein
MQDGKDALEVLFNNFVSEKPHLLQNLSENCVLLLFLQIFWKNITIFLEDQS